ncbi:MAG: GNAT family N-acetyltransferase [Acidimicrobiia bacterium]
MREDGAVIGEIGYFLDADRTTAQVGYSVVEPSWGQGYASEALGALVGHLFGEVGVERITAETLVDQVASRRVIEKAGLYPCGERAGQEDGEDVELVVYELTGAPS